MTDVIVQNIAKEEYGVGNKKIGPNVIEVTINGVTYQFPDAAAIKGEIDKAGNLEIPIKTKLIQYFYQVRKIFPITEERYQSNITKAFSELMEKYPDHLIDINFDFVKSHTVTPEEMKAILKIQRDVKSPFLSIIEPNREQSLEDFVAQLSSIGNPYNQIICPSIDLDTKTPGLFVKKLERILEEKYPRFNVRYASLYTRYGNWLDMSERIFGKDVWCNVTSTPREIFNAAPPHRSLLACTFIYGAHTASHGYGRGWKKDGDDTMKIKKPDEYARRLLDPKSFYYNDSDLLYNECIVKSINNISSETNNMRQYVIDGTFASKYLPQRAGLREELNDLEGRM